MKQFWLGMTSKITEMRDNIKSKMQKDKNSAPENSNNSDEITYEENSVNMDNTTFTEAEVNIEEPKKNKFKRPFRQSDDVYEEQYIEPERKPLEIGKILILSFLLLIIAVGGFVYYYVSNIDWNQHKGKIASQFSEITGKRIVFDGSVHLTFLPSPNLVANDIKIYNPGEDLDEPLAKIKSLTANLTLSSLINGDFDVTMMTLEEPEIRLEIMENGKLNWDGKLTDTQRANLENMQITLDSVMIEKAKLNFIDTSKDINLLLDNLNAEVIAQSIFGPYRIEGTYTKDNNPEGFAFSIGKLSSGFATTVNLVINQPTTETFIRFDGSVLAQNNAVNGNLIFESKKLMEFINSNFKDFNFKPEYNYPLAVALEIKSNKTKVEFTNFVMKYGQTAGAGNLLIPLTETQITGNSTETNDNVKKRTQAELAFNFTDLDLTPIIKFASEILSKYNDGEANYNPNFKFDLLSDIKAVKTIYDGQNIKEFKLSFDLIDNKITIHDLSAILPGNATTSVKGDIYSDLGYMTFNLATNFKTDEFLQTLKWLGIEPQTNLDTVLRRVSGTANITGNFNKFGIAPFDVSIDKSSIKGEAGVINDEKFSIYLNAESDMINFDNYIKPLPKELNDKDFASRMQHRFVKLDFLKDIYAELRLKLDLGIYESIPFENISLNGSLQKGELQLNDLNIGNVANALVNMKGKIKGFGEAPSFENVKYEMETKDFASFLNKLDIKAPDIDLKKLKQFSSKGIVTGSLERMAMKTISKLDNININYGGEISKQNDEFVFNGDLEVRSPDFVKMLNDFNIKYEPKAFALGLFAMKGKLVGKKDYFAINPIDFNIGANTFKGDINYDSSNMRKTITTNLEINKFELDKFFYNEALIKDKDSVAFRQSATENAIFLARPDFDSTKINYAFYNGFDFFGTFKISRMNYKDMFFDFADFNLNLKDGIAKLEEFNADYHGGKITANAELGFTSDNTYLKGSTVLSQYELGDGIWNGGKYGLKGGKADFKIDFNTSANSFEEMFNQLNADVNFVINETAFVGWNLQNIRKDLLDRETADGLTMFIKNNLQNGEEALSKVEGKLKISGGEYILDNANAVGKGVKIAFKDNGSVANWETGIVFSVDYAEPEYLPEFKFSYSGSLSSPILSADTNDLAIMYNKRQADLEAQNEALRQAEADKMKKELESRMMVVKTMESEINNVLRPDLDSKKERAKNPESITGYNIAYERIKNLENSITELYLVAKNPVIDDALLEKISSQNKKNDSEITEIKKFIEEHNINNIKFVIDEHLKLIAEHNKQAKDLAASYKSEFADLGKRLSAIITGYQLDTDANVKRLKEYLEGNIIAIDNIANALQSDYMKIKNSKDSIELGKYAKSTEMQVRDAMKYVPAITQAKQDLLQYAGERVKIEEDTYKKKKEEEEIKRKLEENTGSISVKGTGVSKTVVRDLEDIEKSENAMEKDDVKVLDFSSPSQQSEEKNNKDNNLSDNTESEVLSVIKTEGKISKASGVIIKN